MAVNLGVGVGLFVMCKVLLAMIARASGRLGSLDLTFRVRRSRSQKFWLSTVLSLASLVCVLLLSAFRRRTRLGCRLVVLRVVNTRLKLLWLSLGGTI